MQQIGQTPVLSSTILNEFFQSSERKKITPDLKFNKHFNHANASKLSLVGVFNASKIA